MSLVSPLWPSVPVAGRQCISALPPPSVNAWCQRLGTSAPQYLSLSQYSHSIGTCAVPALARHSRSICDGEHGWPGRFSGLPPAPPAKLIAPTSPGGWRHATATVVNPPTDWPIATQRDVST